MLNIKNINYYEQLEQLQKAYFPDFCLQEIKSIYIKYQKNWWHRLPLFGKCLRKKFKKYYLYIKLYNSLTVKVSIDSTYIKHLKPQITGINYYLKTQSHRSN